MLPGMDYPSNRQEHEGWSLGTDTLPRVRVWCLSPSIRRPQACRNSGSAIAAEALMNEAPRSKLWGVSFRNLLVIRKQSARL